MKKTILKTLSFLYFTTCFFVLMSNNAQAYIDPSAVTYIIQAVAAVLIAIGAALTVFRHKIAAFFKKNKNEEKTEIHVDDDVLDDSADNNKEE